VTNTVYDERRVFVATVVQSTATFFIYLYENQKISKTCACTP